MAVARQDSRPVKARPLPRADAPAAMLRCPGTQLPACCSRGVGVTSTCAHRFRARPLGARPSPGTLAPTPPAILAPPATAVLGVVGANPARDADGGRPCPPGPARRRRGPGEGAGHAAGAAPPAGRAGSVRAPLRDGGAKGRRPLRAGGPGRRRSRAIL
ncbi:unnamed protein product [Rangifer tarandus platyrhynchus]|uniref:Uncharacterized protein n=1 Tax=Rangifer tarandus platyrhynchus TaxID=3082113 RepID=A0ABN8ZS58_RANTA|nr:unnamed protein product [Rangifer tarandus platyrhynchus]